MRALRITGMILTAIVLLPLVAVTTITLAILGRNNLVE